MKKHISKLLLLSLCASLLVGCSSTEENTVTTESTPTATSVEVLSVSSSDLSNTVKLSGKIAPKSEVYVFSLMTAEVLRLDVEVGDRVSKNQFLFSVEEYPTTDLIREINNLQATYDSTKALLDDAIVQISDALEDTRLLYDLGAASLYEVEQLEFSLSQQQSTNQTQLDSLTNSLASLNSQLKDMNDNAVVYAPISGVVTQVNIIENMLATSSQAAVVIADDSQMQIDISVSETLVPYLSAGDTVAVTIPSVSSEAFDAVIGSISPSTNIQTGMYSVKITLPTEQDYYIGMFAEVLFTTDSAIETLNIPSNAIIIGDSSSYVFIVNSDNTASRVYVTTGITDGMSTQILEGLEGGEKLVTTGQEYLSDNSLVSITGGE